MKVGDLVWCDGYWLLMKGVEYDRKMHLGLVLELRPDDLVMVLWCHNTTPHYHHILTLEKVKHESR